MKTLKAARTAGVTLAVTLAVSLSGCGAADSLKDTVKDKADDAASQVTAAAEGLEDKAIEEGVEDLINKLSTDGTQIDIGVDGQASVPSDFPSALPLPNGDLALAVSEEGTWNLSYTVKDSAEADSLVAWFQGRPDFKPADSVNAEGAQVWTFMSADYYVNVALITSIDGTYQLVYGVAATGA